MSYNSKSKELTCKFKFNRHVVYDHHNSISNLIVKINSRNEKKNKKNYFAFVVSTRIKDITFHYLINL